MKILHVFPVTKDIYGKEDDLKDQGFSFSYLVGYILKNADFKIECRVIADEIYKSISAYQPDIVAITAMTFNFNIAVKIAAKAKQMGAKVIIGGCHITALPQQLTKNMDVGVIGEGEKTYLELLNLYHQGKWGPNYFQEVKGIVFRTSDSGLYITPPRPLIKNLDLVGHPNREIVPLTFSTKSALTTARGCAYRCVYCSQTRFWQSKIRFHSPEYVIKEIENVYNFSKTRDITIYDPIFLINKKRLRAIIELWEKHPLYRHINFGCLGRANLIDNEMAELAVRMGIHTVAIGFESNNEESLRYLKGGSVTTEDNQRAYDILTKHKIYVSAGIIIGSPMETEEQIMDTYRFIKKNKLISGGVGHLVSIPGTPVWDYAISRGLVSEDMDFLKLGANKLGKDTIFLSEKVTPEKMIMLFKKFERLFKRRIFFRRVRRWKRYIYKNPFLLLKKSLKLLEQSLAKNKLKYIHKSNL